MAFYARLPLELKESVARRVDTEERLKFLQVNQELQNFTLSRGAFSRNVQSFTIVTYGDPISNELMTNGMENPENAESPPDLKWNDFAIDLVTNRSSYTFRPYKYRVDDAVRITSSSCRLFQMIPSGGVLKFYNCSTFVLPVANESFSMLKFLPTDRNCKNLVIGTDHRSVMIEVLNRILSKITPDTLRFGFVKEDWETVDTSSFDVKKIMNMVKIVEIQEECGIKSDLDKLRYEHWQLAKSGNLEAKKEVLPLFRIHNTFNFLFVGLHNLSRLLPGFIQIYAELFVLLSFSIYASAGALDVIEHYLRIPLDSNWPPWLLGIYVFASASPFVVLLLNLDKSLRTYSLAIGFSIMCFRLSRTRLFLMPVAPVASQFLTKLWCRREPLSLPIFIAFASIGSLILMFFNVESSFFLLTVCFVFWNYYLCGLNWMISFILDLYPNLVSLAPN